MAGTPQKIIIGDVKNSQVVIGDNNNVVLYQANQPPKVVPIPSPVVVGRPHRSIDLLDREQERNTVQNALTSGSPVEFYAEEGFGKTTLISHISSQLQLPDGMVYLSGRGKPLEDLLQELFTAFYRSDQVYKPSQVEYLRRFEKINALIVLDDITLTREELQTLLNDLPACVFILSCPERNLWDQGESIHLAGLPSDAAVDLFEKKMGRSLTEAERSSAEKICGTLLYNPLHIIQCAAAVQDGGKSIDEMAGELQAHPSEKALHDRLLTLLPESKKRVMALLSTIHGAPLPVEHIAKMANVENLPQLLASMLQQNLIQAHSPRYSLVDDLGSYLREAWDLTEWKDVLLRYFVDWTSRPQPQELILDSADALFAVLGIAAGEERWQDLLRIGRAIEPAFIMSGQWGAWLRLLNLLKQAGQILGDRSTQAWVYHQLGSRALSLGNSTEASDMLGKALEIRNAIGDRSGAAATRQNLQYLKGGPAAQTPPGSKSGLSSGGKWILGLLGGAVILTGLIITALFASALLTPVPTPTPTASSTPTLTSTLTSTATLTPTITPSATPTPTTSITPTITPNDTPPAPVIVFNPSYQDNDFVMYVPCPNYHVELDWKVPSDTSGIDLYEVRLDYDNGNGFKTILDQFVKYPSTNLDITKQISATCPANLRALIRARDRDGAWSDWYNLNWKSEIPPAPIQ